MPTISNDALLVILVWSWKKTDLLAVFPIAGKLSLLSQRRRGDQRAQGTACGQPFVEHGFRESKILATVSESDFSEDLQDLRRRLCFGTRGAPGTGEIMRFSDMLGL